MDNLLPYLSIRNTHKGIYDVELQNIDRLKKFSSVECHVLVYPLSRNIVADDVSLNPYEEYAEDIKDGYNSRYSKINFLFNKFLGLTMSLVIFLLFLAYAPQAFLSIDSVVAIFAAYIIGKELGQDLESLFVNVSSNWKIHFYRDYFKYRLERSSSLTNYSQYAKRYRYGKPSISPSKMDFDKRSNSQIVRMKFNHGDLGTEQTAHILSIRVSEELINEYENKGYMISFKLCLNKDSFLFTKSLELSQAICKGNVGCLGKDDELVKDGVYFKNVVKGARFKYDGRSGIIKGKIIA